MVLSVSASAYLLWLQRIKYTVSTYSSNYFFTSNSIYGLGLLLCRDRQIQEPILQGTVYLFVRHLATSAPLCVTAAGHPNTTIQPTF